MKALAADDPRVIGEYRLRAQLGAGGMGRVYLGLSPAGRAVAVKVVHPELANDGDFLRRFSQEVAAARAVSGIYTAPVVASGLDERPPWLATAFVPGPSLDQVVAEHGPLPEQALWPLLGGLTEALQAIHACGVVHRDLKPANVLLATDGPRVIDFGISRAADGTSLTAAGVVFGTPGYMSPEQAEGRGAGPESDVFALACVVAYGATGTGPFGTGTAAAILYRVVHAEPDLGRVPPRLREVLTACLAKDPAARPTLRDLSRTLAGRPDSTGPSAVAFWPSPVAGLIGAYQARLEQETRTVSRPADGFSWAGAAHRPAAPADPGRPAAPGWPHAGYPRPQGYGPAGGSSAQVSAPPYAPPRGYPAGSQANGEYQANGAQVRYPQAYQAGARPVIAQAPSTVLTAVRLMYAGAAYTLVWAIGVIIVEAGIVKDHPVLTAGADHRLAGAAGFAVVTALVQIALWLGLARACRRGRKAARVAGTVLFGVYTLGTLGTVASAQAGLGPAKVLTLIGWLIGFGAVVALWRRPSSAFFAARTSQNR
jgi:Protein kinase domain